MVLHKRLDYGFNGYEVPFVPRSSRSARRRRVFKRKAEDSEMCAIELLATIAGNLLQENEVSPTPSNVATRRVQPPFVKATVKQEQHDEDPLLKAKPCDPGSCDESVFVSDIGLKGQKQNFRLKDFDHSENNLGLELNSIITKSDCSEKAGHTESEIVENRNDFLKISSKGDGDSPCCGDSSKSIEVNGNDIQLESDRRKISNVIIGNVPDACSSEYPMELDIKPPGLVSSDSSVEVPMCGDHIPRSSFLPFRDDVKVVSKDDDENSSGCTRPCTGNIKAVRPPPRIGDRRIRKLLASKYWKVAPKLNDGEISNSDIRSAFRHRKAFYTRQRSQRNSLFKRRKLFGHCSMSTSERRATSDGFSNSLKKSNDGNSTGSASGPSSSGADQSSFRSRDSHVKLSIKSFRVPELFIEIPETATVGSLKRTVMEAVNAILGGGLRVGVVLQGKKVRDDNKTLLQTGISDDDKRSALGFTLEPNPTPPPASAPVPVPVCQSVCPEDPPCVVHCNTPQPLPRYPATPNDSAPSDASLHPTLTNMGNILESDRDSVRSPTDLSADKMPSGSGALVAIPTGVEALTVVPLHRKSRRSELAQRRIRRPFSVTEVEALVQAVEKLGTGRWRDVKIRAFDNAKHRTYVDLKDKWKTLVHTARISPQQRRGEPVPQELLDRVLAAHAYWSQMQAKQQVKQQTETCLLL